MSRTQSKQVELKDSVAEIADRKSYAEVNTNEQRVRGALIEMGWTPPGKSDYITLENALLEVLYDDRWWAVDNEEFALHLLRHGPQAVRVRRRE